MRLAVAMIAGALATMSTGAQSTQTEWVTDRDKLWKVVDGALVEAGKLVFSDRFDQGPAPSSDWKLDGAHVWRVESGIMSNTGYGGAATLARDLGEGFVVEVKVKPLATEPGRDGGFTGIEAGGILFTLQPHRWWWMYRRDGETRSTGSWKTEPVPLGNWYQFKIVRQPGGAYSWYVDGRLIVHLIEPGVKGGLAFRGWRLKAAYDDVKVYAIDKKADGEAAEEGRINLVRNGSFEQFNDQIPPFWSPTRFREIPLLFGNLEAFRESWTIDLSERREGAASMRLGGERLNGLHSYYCNLRTGQPCVFSGWLKSDVTNMPVTLSIQPGASQVVMVDREWRQYSLSLANPATSRVRLGVVPRAVGRVWVDAVQLEEGTKATTYRPNPLDAGGGKAIAEERIPTYRIPKAGKPPVLDGVLQDPAWDRHARLPELRIPTPVPGRYLAPSEKTEVYLCHDATNLYAAFRCHVSQKGTNKPGAADEVELFLDPQLNRASYYWFRVNAAGEKRQCRQLNASWAANWTAVTTRGEGFWTAEIAIPLASLELGPLTGKAWGINVARSNRNADEHSCLAPVLNRGMYFHNVARYPVFDWDDPAVLEPYRLVSKGQERQNATAAVEANIAPRCLRVNGKPFFVFAPLQVFHVPTAHPYKDYDATIETMMSYWAKNGFKTIMVGANIDAETGRWGERIWDKVLSYADATGMKVIVFWTGPGTRCWCAIMHDWRRSSSAGNIIPPCWPGRPRTNPNSTQSSRKKWLKESGSSSNGIPIIQFTSITHRWGPPADMRACPATSYRSIITSPRWRGAPSRRRSALWTKWRRWPSPGESPPGTSSSEASRNIIAAKSARMSKRLKPTGTWSKASAA